MSVCESAYVFDIYIMSVFLIMNEYISNVYYLGCCTLHFSPQSKSYGNTKNFERRLAAHVALIYRVVNDDND